MTSKTTSPARSNSKLAWLAWMAAASILWTQAAFIASGAWFDYSQQRRASEKGLAAIAVASSKGMASYAGQSAFVDGCPRMLAYAECSAGEAFEAWTADSGDGRWIVPRWSPGALAARMSALGPVAAALLAAGLFCCARATRAANPSTVERSL